MLPAVFEVLLQTETVTSRQDFFASLRKQAAFVRKASKRMALTEIGESEVSLFPWHIYDSALADYDGDLSGLVGEFGSIETYLTDVFSERVGELVGVEIGGPGSRLFEGFRESGLFRRSLGVTLVDLRGDEVRASDRTNGHDVVVADAFTSIPWRISRHRVGGWGKVRSWVAENGKADFVIERMVGGLGAFAGNCGGHRLFMLNVARWYRLLREGGVMFVELPKGMGAPLDTFERFSDSIEVTRGASWDRFSRRATGTRFVRVRRLPGSPDRLEGLTDRMIEECLV